MCPTPTLLRFILKIHLDYTWVTLWCKCNEILTNHKVPHVTIYLKKIIKRKKNCEERKKPFEGRKSPLTQINN